MESSKKRKDPPPSYDEEILDKLICGGSLTDTIHFMDHHSVDPNTVLHIDDNPTLLMRAIHFRNEPVAYELIRRGATVSGSVDAAGWTPLHYAAAFGNLDLLKTIASHYAPGVEPRTHIGHTPLMCAVYQHDEGDRDESSTIGVVIHLLEQRADINRQDDDGCTPLLLACRFSRHVSVVELLLESGATTNVVTKYGNNALMLALRNKEIDKAIFRLLVSHKEDPHHVNPKTKQTVLEAAYVNAGGSALKHLAPFCRVERTNRPSLKVSSSNPDPMGSMREYRAFAKYAADPSIPLESYVDAPKNFWATLRFRHGTHASELFSVMSTCKDHRVWRHAISEFGTQRSEMSGDTLLHVAVRANNEAAIRTWMRLGLNPLMRNGKDKAAIDETSVPQLRALLREYAVFQPTLRHALWYGPCFVERAFTFMCVVMRWSNTQPLGGARTGAHLVLRELAQMEYV